MQEKRTPVLNEEPKYKKKSTAKGQPRSKHKHIYETVLLTRYYHFTDYKTGRLKKMQSVLPTKVCTICGRVGEVDYSPSLYVKKFDPDIPFIYEKKLSEKALSLPKWYVEEFWDKFAIKESDLIGINNILRGKYNVSKDRKDW